MKCFQVIMVQVIFVAHTQILSTEIFNKHQHHNTEQLRLDVALLLVSTT